MRGDLDAILNKALKKDPAQRYASVDAFAQDLQRHLDGDIVQARPDGAGYRLRKFAARHRLPLTAAGAVAVALVAATAVSLSQARAAERQRIRAEELLARNEAVSEFVNLMLTEVASPDQPITIDELLERSESMIESGVTRNPEHQATILALLGSYYTTFGSPAKTEALMRKALALTRNSEDLALRARLECSYAYARSQLGTMDEALVTLKQFSEDPKTPPAAAARCYQHRAFVAQNTNQAADALDYALRAQAKLEQADREDAPLEAAVLGDIGYGYQLTGKLDEAERYFAQSMRMFESSGRAEHPDSVTVRNNWGLAIYAAGDVRRALAKYEEGIRIAGKHVAGGTIPPYLLANRALTLNDLARFDEANAEYDRVIAFGEKNGSAQ